MEPNQQQQDLLRRIPGVDHILELLKGEACFDEVPKTVKLSSARKVTEALRARILADDAALSIISMSDQAILEQAKTVIQQASTPNLRRTINATGVVVHTNLGRSLLSAAVLQNLETIASRYSNLEFDLAAGKRGSRYSAVEDLICEISGAEAAMVVNNNAGAVLLCLETIARGRKVIVSRGELVEIGGSFRIPDVMAKSGASLLEVGTTNRTHPKDYEKAIDHETGLLLKVHTSNYNVVGFTAEVDLAELVAIGTKYQIPVMEDLGSGTFVDFSQYGLTKEPTVQTSVKTGADIITFSGDKLLGGPQAGIIVGQKAIVDKVKQNPITRALRIDKMTLAALEGTLRLYRDETKAIDTIPTLRMLLMPLNIIAVRAQRLAEQLSGLGDPRLDLQVINHTSKAGGGSLPLLELPTKGVSIRIKGLSANTIENALRQNSIPIIGRIEDNAFLVDLRTVQEDELELIVEAFNVLLERTTT
jgi:L-seryl-tRNA(Ser) seleniumtransferase